MLTGHEEVIVIILGTIFLFIGIAACGIALVRGRNVSRILGWFGIFSAMYGIRLFAEVPAALSLLVGPFWRSGPRLVWIITYLILIPALFFWIELSLGTLMSYSTFYTVDSITLLIPAIGPRPRNVDVYP